MGSLLGHIGIEAIDGKVNIVVGSVVLEYTTYQTRTIIAELRDAIADIEGLQPGICATQAKGGITKPASMASPYVRVRDHRAAITNKEREAL